MMVKGVNENVNGVVTAHIRTNMRSYIYKEKERLDIVVGL